MLIEEIDNNKTTVEIDDPNNPISKSNSIPASIQTIVRFQNGSNMSLQHKVLF